MKSAFACGLILFGLSLFGCKKDDEPEKTCRLTTITAAGTTPTVINYTYDSEGRIQSSTNTAGSNTYKSVFTYSAGTIIISRSSGATLTGRDSIRHNEAGQVTYMRTYYLPGTNYYENVYTYNGNGEVLKQVSNNNDLATPNPNPPLTTTTYAFTNGNYTSSGSGDVLEYYTDKSYRLGDYVQIAQLISYGTEAVIFKNKNMLKSAKFGSNISNFNYTFDSEDKVSQMRVTQDTSILDYNYQYQCD